MCFAAALAGCAAQPEAREQKPRGAEEIVAERAQAKWNALIADKLSEAYKLYSPSSREVMSYEDFVRSIRRGFWKTAKVEKVTCESADACEVQVAIEYSYKGSLIKTPVSETWIRRDGTWWFVQRS